MNEKHYTLRTHIVLSYVIFLIALFIDIILYNLNYICKMEAVLFSVVSIVLIPIFSRLIWSWSNSPPPSIVDV